MKRKISITFDLDVFEFLENESDQIGIPISTYLNILIKNLMRQKKEKQLKKE